MEQPKKLIEVAMPIKEISAESMRDKSIRHGHISTLHLWWARRPLPVCRAVVFASLVPDPLDVNCPKVFKDAVDILLGKATNAGDPYKPYDDIPYTAANDMMKDNLRNRLLMFIGKFSERYILNEKQGRNTNPKEQLSDSCLIKWESRNNDEIINKARKLIWVAHNSIKGIAAHTLITEFDQQYTAIKKAEIELYSLIDRHKGTETVKTNESKLQNAINAFLNKMPRVFDPFAGGGAIPLEASRLGCQSFGNDINPVAHIIQKGSLEFPQKYGKPILYSRTEFIKLYGKSEFDRTPNENKVLQNGEVTAVNIPNRLSFDVEFYARKLLTETEKEVGFLYPADEKGNKPVAYYWARVGKCNNPSCRAEVPLLGRFYLANTKTKQVYLKPIIKGKTIDFEIKTGDCAENGWMSRGNLQCPVCGNITDVNTLKEQFLNVETSERLLAVIWESNDGKIYKLPRKIDFEITARKLQINARPLEAMPVKYTQALPSCTWGLSKWGDLFSDRQMFILQSLLVHFTQMRNDLSTDNEYNIALLTYLGIFVDRIAVVNTSFGVWHTGGEKLERIMGRQAIPMVFDYPESNPFCTSSGSALNQLDWITRYIDSESQYCFSTVLQNASSGEKTQFSEKFLTAVVTDPPYYDAIAYADLSDFFYVWLKRTLGSIFPLNFATPETPKSEECTALKHHHNGNLTIAKIHFENKLLDIFDSIEYQTSDLVSIMFAHQSTEAWTTLCNSILGARMNITGSWANDTEMTGALKTDKAFLSSSVTVACKPSQRQGIGGYKEVKKEIEKTVEKEVTELYQLGFRGADLLTACFGQAVSVFGQFEKVEKADGSEVTVAELLDMAKESAFNALLKGFDGDDFTKFYIGWLQLFGFTESDFDDAAKFARVGLTINVSDLFAHNLFIKKGNKQELAGYKERLVLNHRIGEGSNSFIIDFVHKAMALYEGANRYALLAYIAKVAASPDNSFWRVITSLCEILPQGSDDYKQASGLLLNKDSLIRESKNIQQSAGAQGQLF